MYKRIYTKRKHCKPPKSIIPHMANQNFSDNGTEYKNKAFSKYCVSKEIAPEFTVPETIEQNGVAKRFKRTVVEAARCLLIDSKMTKSYWV